MKYWLLILSLALFSSDCRIRTSQPHPPPETVEDEERPKLILSVKHNELDSNNNLHVTGTVKNISSDSLPSVRPVAGLFNKHHDPVNFIGKLFTQPLPAGAESDFGIIVLDPPNLVYGIYFEDAEGEVIPMIDQSILNKD